jgi:large subunit ribosomal protein L22
MEYKAIYRYARISPQKVRVFADLVRGKTADVALSELRFHPNRGARFLEEVIRSAMANAEEQGETKIRLLEVVDVRVDCGPMFRRMKPKSRGMSAIIKKRMAHISVTLG